MHGSKNVKFEFLVEMSIKGDRFMALDITLGTYQNE